MNHQQHITAANPYNIDRSTQRKIRHMRSTKGLARKQHETRRAVELDPGVGCTWYEMEAKVMVSFWMGRRSLASTAWCSPSPHLQHPQGPCHKIGIDWVDVAPREACSDTGVHWIDEATRVTGVAGMIQGFSHAYYISCSDSRPCRGGK